MLKDRIFYLSVNLGLYKFKEDNDGKDQKIFSEVRIFQEFYEYFLRFLQKVIKVKDLSEEL